MKTALVILALLSFCSCSRPGTRSDLVGTYIAKVGSGTDLMKLNEDGSFDEELSLPNGKRFSNHGDWKLVGDDAIHLEKAFFLSSDFPPTGSVPTSGWNVPLHWTRPIEFGHDEYVWFVKSDPAGAQRK